jgi:hypothetical protein
VTPDKVRENRLRLIADSRGLRLVKSGRRDPNALDFARYALVDYETGGAVNPSVTVATPVLGRSIRSRSTWRRRATGRPGDGSQT